LLTAQDDATLVKYGKALMKQMSEEDAYIAICTNPNIVAWGPKVHTVYLVVKSGAVWPAAKDWMEK
jgi:hypothetical protein